eukprot:386320-Amphidinium_carterae.1
MPSTFKDSTLALAEFPSMGGSASRPLPSTLIMPWMAHCGWAVTSRALNGPHHLDMAASRNT